MKIIKLYGHLGKKYGKIHRYSINSPQEAIKLLIANYKEFEKDILNFQGIGYRIILGKESIGIDEINNYTGQEVIKIVPIISGAGGDGALRKIIIGVALIAVAYYMPVFAAKSFGAYATQAIAYYGTSLVYAGISQLLYNAPSEDPEAEKSVAANFDGPINTVREGLPVPVGYGTLLVGGAVISVGFTTTNIPIGAVI